ncbi:MAG: hypothetical protein FJX54_24660, partial [Alphaproteobacteria bacterium]|nr:hypothetical protein [Alphaproteobacteria bacterium]
MRKVRDVLRLSAGGMSKRKIAASLCISPTAAGECLRRARRAGLGWPLPAEMSDETLESRLYPAPTNAKDYRPLPDWPAALGEPLVSENDGEGAAHDSTSGVTASLPVRP